MRRGWWNGSAFFPNFAAVAFDGIALVRMYRMPPPKGSPSGGSLLQIATLSGREYLVHATREGMGQNAWVDRATYVDPALDPALRQALTALLETESWSLVREEDWV